MASQNQSKAQHGTAKDIEEEIMSVLFRPPILRSTTGDAIPSLNKALFAKKIELAAASIVHTNQISNWRRRLLEAKEILKVDRISSVVNHPDHTPACRGRKCLLLRPGVKADVPETFGPALTDGVQREELGVIPYELDLDYEYWSYHDVMRALLPEELHRDIPGGFNAAGHVAHLNLRNHFLPYKHLIADILLDKNPHIRTVINKTDKVGSASQFRTFSYELLAGEDDLEVSISEGGCVFDFNYAKVFWNSKLEPEHRRVVALFKPGEVVVDLMAGIGPFAVPAGRRGVFVWANDMNPESFACLTRAIERNKVAQYVKPFLRDGRAFAREAADHVLERSREGYCAEMPTKRYSRSAGLSRPEPERVPLPPTISHVVMNLPASAVTFLSCFRGLYAGHEDLFSSGGGEARKLPMVHVHCFGEKVEGDGPLREVVERVNWNLGTAHMQLGAEPWTNDEHVSVCDVRDVAPSKRMFCATFRLPREVAFAPRD